MQTTHHFWIYIGLSLYSLIAIKHNLYCREWKESTNFRNDTRRFSQAPVDKEGELNVYYCKGLVDHLKNYLLPFAGLWTEIMLG